MSNYPAGATQLTQGQLETLWTQEGGDPSQAAYMANVALAESGGVYGPPNVVAPGDQNNPNPGDASYGLWQINSGYWGNAFGLNTIQESADNPQLNAAEAVYVAAHQGLGAWTDSFTAANPSNATPQPVNNTYLTTLQNGIWSDNSSPVSSLLGGSAASVLPGGAAASAAANGAQAAAGSAANALTGGVAGAIANAQAAFVNFWKTHPSGLLIAGILVFVLAIAFILSDKNVQQAAFSAAKDTAGVAA